MSSCAWLVSIFVIWPDHCRQPFLSLKLSAVFQTAKLSCTALPLHSVHTSCLPSWKPVLPLGHLQSLRIEIICLLAPLWPGYSRRLRPSRSHLPLQGPEPWCLRLHSNTMVVADSFTRSIFFYYDKTHIKFTIITILKCTIQWHFLYSQCCLPITV